MKKDLKSKAAAWLVRIRDDFNFYPVSIYADPCYTGHAKVGLRKWNYEADLHESDHPTWKYLIENFDTFAPLLDELGLIAEKVDLQESIFVLKPALETKRAKAVERKLARKPDYAQKNIRGWLKTFYKK